MIRAVIFLRPALQCCCQPQYMTYDFLTSVYCVMTKSLSFLQYFLAFTVAGKFFSVDTTQSGNVIFPSISRTVLTQHNYRNCSPECVTATQQSLHTFQHYCCWFSAKIHKLARQICIHYGKLDTLCTRLT